MGFNHHKFLARPLKGGLIADKGLHRLVHQEILETYIDLLKINCIGGTGGLLSHAPRRVQSALLLIDGFRPEGVTKLVQDSVFMMPHLGILSTVHPKAAMEIFEKDCLVRVGTCIAPKGVLKGKQEGVEIAKITLKMLNGEVLKKELRFGTMMRIPLREKEKAEIEINPRSGFDVGQGPGHVLKTTVEGGVAGIIFDGRGRPLNLPEDEEARKKKLVEWFTALDAYPGYERER